MKIVIPLFILMSLLITEAIAHPTGTLDGLLTVEPGDRQFTFRWTHPSGIDFTNPDNFAYQVNIGTVTATHWGWDNRGNLAIANPYLTVRSLTNGREYTYRIRAFHLNADGSTHYSATWLTVQVTPMIPAPTSFRATAGDGQVTLNWDKPISGSSCHLPIQSKWWNLANYS